MEHSHATRSWYMFSSTIYSSNFIVTVFTTVRFWSLFWVTNPFHTFSYKIHFNIIRPPRSPSSKFLISNTKWGRGVMVVRWWTVEFHLKSRKFLGYPSEYCLLDKQSVPGDIHRPVAVFIYSILRTHELISLPLLYTGQQWLSRHRSAASYCTSVLYFT